MKHPQIKSVVGMLEIMSSGQEKRVCEIAEELDVCPKTVYRYIHTFEGCGFTIDNPRRGIYRIAEFPKTWISSQNYVFLTKEEATFLISSMEGLTDSSSLKPEILEKLTSISCYDGLTTIICRKGRERIISILASAMKKKRKVILREYESGHSNTVRDRKVEPFRFSENFLDVIGVECPSGKNKTFKISRIHDVVLLNEHWTMEHLHRNNRSDCFRICGDLHEHIILKMGLKAKNLMLEEYPLTEPFLRKDGRKWILDTWVSGMEGVGRFVIGLYDDIKILEGAMLDDYIRTYTHTYLP